MGPEVTELEKKLADYLGIKHAIACLSGTDTHLMAMKNWVRKPIAPKSFKGGDHPLASVPEIR